MEGINDKLTNIISIENNDRYYFGKILGGGFFSIAIKVDYPFLNSDVRDSLNSPVLIITTEKEKESIMREIFGNDKVCSIDVDKNFNEAKENWLYENNFKTMEQGEEEGYEFFYDVEASDFDLHPLFQRLEDEGLYVFYMENCEAYSSVESHIVSYLFQELGKLVYPPSFFENFSTGFTEEDILEKINNGEYAEIPKEDGEKFSKKIFSLLEKTERDISRIAKKLKDLTDNVSLDIHSEQYLSLNGYVVCSDPFNFQP